MPDPVKENLESVFSRWMQERFKKLSYEEVIKMFVELTPLENTRSYKELVAIGEKKGEISVLNKSLCYGTIVTK